MDFKNTQTQSDVEETPLTIAEQATVVELQRAYHLTTNAAIRKAALEIEKEVKGFYVTHLFNKLNLTRFR